MEFDVQHGYKESRTEISNRPRCNIVMDMKAGLDILIHFLMKMKTGTGLWRIKKRQ